MSDLPRKPFKVEKWEVKLGWSPENRAWGVMVILEIGEKTTLDIVLSPQISEALAESLIQGSQMARIQPPHPIGSQH